MNKVKIRDILRFTSALIVFWLYVPHLLMYHFSSATKSIKSDIERISNQVSIALPIEFMLLYELHNNSYFRSLFYYRIGPIAAMVIGWWRPGNRYFQISYKTKIGPGVLIAHPFATIINAESIGNNFSCIHSTTIGAKASGRPIIGNNVSLGANVVIIGNITIGNNVVIGAGAVVVKDIPDNSLAVGNPARVIRKS